jgi:hypothetical protein
MNQVMPLGGLHARDDVAERVVAHMAHMDAARRIGEHFEDIVALARVVALDDEGLPVLPHLLPVGLHFARVVAFDAHVSSSIVFWKAPKQPPFLAFHGEFG